MNGSYAQTERIRSKTSQNVRILFAKTAQQRDLGIWGRICIFDADMEIIGTILLALVFVLTPAGVMWLCRKVAWLGKIGPVLILYILGVIIGNLVHVPYQAQLQDILSSAAVPLAIPLMLFTCTFRRSETRSQLLALITGLVAVITAVIAGYFIFGKNIADAPKIGGMLTGVYTGGTINLAALKTMLGVPEETFILMNSYDMLISFLFLTFLLSFGIRWFRKILRTSPGMAEMSSVETVEGAGTGLAEGSETTDYRRLFTKEGLKDAGFLLLTDILIIGISAGLAVLAGDGWFMTVLILMLTTLGIAASFWKPVRRRKGSYEIGMYLIYIFSIVVASMADITALDFKGGAALLGYLTFVIFGSLILQVILAKIFRIDADTMMISSVTYICSPPFVPMMATAMKNPRIIAAGLAIGVVGYAAGNYLGFIIERLLSLF